MGRTEKGFTLIELMIVVVIIGILAAFAIPNFLLMQNRAKEGSTKANMHTLQVAAEDYGVQNDGTYSDVVDATHIYNVLPGAGSSFRNPFSGGTGIGTSASNAIESRATFAAPAATQPGISSYADSATTMYNIKGYGKDAALTLVLTSS